MKILVIGAQGVFYNAFFLAYLTSPRTCHRFVGYLEEEAVITVSFALPVCAYQVILTRAQYTRAIADIEDGKLPEFETMLAPDIALQYVEAPSSKTRTRTNPCYSYWNMPKDSTMKDLLLYIRADEYVPTTVKLSLSGN